MKMPLYHDDLLLHVIMCNHLMISPDNWELLEDPARFWRCYVQSDDGVSIEIGGKTTDLKGGLCYIIPAGIVFKSRVDRTLGQFFLHFDVHGLYGLVMKELFSDLICLPETFPLTETARDLARRRAAGEENDVVMQAQAKGLLYCALGSYLESLPEERIDRSMRQAAILEPLMPAIRHIESHLNEPLSNRTLADLCCISEGHFIRMFRTGLGQTPVQYILECRVRYAAHELYTTDKNIETIAAEAGFGSRFYFHRVFTRLVGETPSAYRHAPR